MKRNIILFALVGLLASSCVKDGDFDALNNDLSLHGVVNPVLGIPIASGSVTVHDFIHMVQISDAKVETGSDDVITIYYDDTTHNVIDLEGKKPLKVKNGSKSTGRVIVEKPQEGSVTVDLFENLTFMDTNQIEVDSILVYLDAYVKAAAENIAYTTQAIQNYHVLVYYNHLNLTVEGQNGDTRVLKSKYNQPGDSLAINELLNGEHIILFDNEDISEAINMRPKIIRYSVKMNIEFTPEFFASNLDENSFVVDSIGINQIDLDTYLKAKFPIAAYMKDLSYPVDIDMELSTEMDNLTIDSSYFYLKYSNGIPIDLALDLKLLDANGNPLCTLLTQNEGLIKGAPVKRDTQTGRIVADGESKNSIPILITKNVYDNLMNAKKLRLDGLLNTSTLSNSVGNDRVTVTADDKLSLLIYFIGHPSYEIDIDMGSSDDKKGGVR